MDDEAFFDAIESTIKSGIHTKKPMGKAYFHTPAELRGEIEAAGFEEAALHGVIGPCWLMRNLDEAWKDDKKRGMIMRLVRLLDGEESLMGLSTHFLCAARKSVSDKAMSALGIDASAGKML